MGLWFLVIYWGAAAVVIPTPYPSEAACESAAHAPHHGAFPYAFYCIPTNPTGD